MDHPLADPEVRSLSEAFFDALIRWEQANGVRSSPTFVMAGALDVIRRLIHIAPPDHQPSYWQAVHDAMDRVEQFDRPTPDVLAQFAGGPLH